MTADKKNQKRTLHLVSHTHWDREWYLPFQLFRLQLVALVDGLLEILDSDPDYKHFTLDGQTIVLDDYLEVRPENEARIRKYVQNGRLLIGPWYILPDEFLVSPEATIRNLLSGDRKARQFGPKMQVGYIPDPFGHIGQMPQILRGFGIDNACMQRGLADEPCEFLWRAADGSTVLVANLRDGYMNAVHLPASQADAFVCEIRRLRDSLLPHTLTNHLLLMHGNDHTPAVPDTGQAISAANDRLEHDVIVHSSLPQYIHAIQSQIAGENTLLPVVQGELRSCKRHHLLPGVYSTRMWIKQRNHECETLLEKWAEPFSTWAGLLRNDNPSASILRHAWQLLMQCHPHDSICGCSIDQVHREMRPRFDQVEQVAGEVTRQSLYELAAAVATRSPAGQNDDDFLAVVVYNPTASLRTELVDVEVEWPQDVDEFEFVAAHMGHVPFNTLETVGRELLNVSVDRETVAATLNLIQGGRAAGFALQNVKFRKNDRQLHIFLRLSDTREPDLGVWEWAQQAMQNYLSDAEIEEFTITARTPTSARLVLLAQDVPAYGLRTFWARRSSGDKTRHSRAEDTSGPPYVIENEYFQVQASAQDGTLTITDKRTGVVYGGLNRFVDGGDSGDEYNYSPPPDDLIVDTGQVQAIRLHRDAVEQFIELRLALHVPKKLNRDRRSRSAEKASLAIKTRVSLVPGVARIDVRTQVDNGDPPISDHRLRVHFPAPFKTDFAAYDGHFEVIDRPVALPEYDSIWREAPRPERPQRAFASLSDGETGLTIANRGLPEVEALQDAQGQAEIALTLLRCVGWLSREDLSTRKGHAGPMIATPEAQMPGSYDFDYAIIPHSGNWEGAYAQAYAFNAPLRAVTTGLHAGHISPASSFISISHAAFIVSAIKAAEDRSGWILRGFNLSAEPIDVQITCAVKFERAARVNLAEEFEQELAVQNNNRVEISVGGHQIITVKFW